MLLSEKISVIRKMNGLSQEQFAEELSVSRQAVSKWETGASVPDIKTLIKIADFYSITLDELVRDEYALPFSPKTEPAEIIRKLFFLRICTKAGYATSL